jgi:2-methylisocitrate lyase-like PEP mutase family enzyme
LLASLGFKALATTSAGFAFTLGRLDGGVTLDEVVEHIRVLDSATKLPVSADLENGYGRSPEDAALAVSRAAEAGAAGGSIEDWDPENGIYEVGFAAERVTAAVEAARATGFVLTARAENYVRGNPDLDDTIARLQAYEEAGADVLYAPRLPTVDETRAICEAVSKPVNVLAAPGMTLAEIVDAGAQRISLGGWLALTAAAAAARAAEAIRDAGDFSALSRQIPIKDWLA